jgi:hypothetical protein
MLVKNILDYQVHTELVPNGAMVSVSDGEETKKIPLFPSEVQAMRALDDLEKTKWYEGISFEYFYMIVTGCLSLNMKRSF